MRELTTLPPSLPHPMLGSAVAVHLHSQPPSLVTMTLPQ